jgi:hypothetical protein
MSDIVVLGAEAQAATSIAFAYPDRSVTFVSDHDIVDGADLPNVRMFFAKTADRAKLTETAAHVVPLSPRWIERPHRPSLSSLFETVERHFPGRMLPVFARPGRSGRWIVKGDHWHRPDAPLSGTAQQLEEFTDVHGCGLVYQPLCQASATIMAIGRRERGIQLGCLRVFHERFFWDNILQAAETINAPDVVAVTLELLDGLHYRDYFSFNWLQVDSGLRLSSLRPVPRAIFQMFRRGGIDLLADPPGVKVLRPGLRMVAAPNYVSFQRLSS